MKPDVTYHEFDADPGLTHEVLHICNWLLAKRRERPDFVETLSPMDLTSAFNKASGYFEEVNQRDLSEVEEDADIKTVMRFPNGWRIVQLLSPLALKYEGTYTGHCLGKGAYLQSLLSEQETFYSLRDAKNKPHATMEVVVEGNILLQCKGKQDSPPVEKYMPMLRQFLSAQKFRLEESTVNCGLVQDGDGQYHSANNLPKNLSIAGNLNLYGCKSLKQLPKGLSVGGSLSLLACPDLKSIPRTIVCQGEIRTDLGTFSTVAAAADAFDRHYGAGSATPSRRPIVKAAAGSFVR
jgi:hypothetical protein